MSKESLILTEMHGRVALLRLNRPEAMNALNTPLMVELMDALEKLDADDRVGAFVLTGDARAFAAGADIKEMAGATPVSLMVANNFARWGTSRTDDRYQPALARMSGPHAVC